MCLKRHINEHEYAIEMRKIGKSRMIPLSPSKFGCMSARGTESAEVLMSEK